MAVDMFLKIDDVKGEAQDARHKDEIEVLSWTWVTQSITVHGGAVGGAGKASFEDVTVTKWVDLASPTLLGAVSTGRHFKEAFLTVRGAGGTPFEYLKLKLTLSGNLPLVEVRLRGDRASSESLQRLKSLLEMHPGKSPVRLHLELPEGGEVTIAAAASLSIAADQVLRQELEEAFGPGCVTVG